MGKICEQFEAETPTDSEATQKARFEVVLDLMQQVRALAICSLLLSAWKFSGGGVLEGCPTAKPRWREGEHKKGHIAWSSGESIETIAQILPLDCHVVFWDFSLSHVSLSLFSSYRIWVILQKSWLGRW